jgi:serine/threonine protein kinase
MIDSVKNLKVKSLKEWFNASIPNDAIDLISRMLDFNPHRRPTAVEILQHPYLSQFHNINEETVSPSIIRPPISDNKKLSLKEYRNLLYEQIKRVYNRDSTISTPSGGSILTPTPGTVNRTASDMLSPKRVSEKEPITREQSHHKYS